MKLKLKNSVKLWQVTFDNGCPDVLFVAACDIEAAIAAFKEDYCTYAVLDVKLMSQGEYVRATPILIDDGVIDQVDAVESEPGVKQNRQTDEEFVRQFCECKLMAVDDHPEFGFKLCVKAKSGASRNFASRNKSSLWKMAAKWIQGNDSTTVDQSIPIGQPYDREKADAESNKQFVLANYPYAKAMNYTNYRDNKGWAILDWNLPLIISGFFDEESGAWDDAANKISKGAQQTDKEFVRSVYPGAGIRVNPLTVWVYDELNHCDLSAALHSSSEAWENAAERIRRSKPELSSDEEFVKANAEYALTTHSDPKRPFKYELFLTGAKCPFVSNEHEEVFSDAAKWIRNQVKK